VGVDPPAVVVEAGAGVMVTEKLELEVVGTTMLLVAVTMESDDDVLSVGTTMLLVADTDDDVLPVRTTLLLVADTMERDDNVLSVGTTVDEAVMIESVARTLSKPFKRTADIQYTRYMSDFRWGDESLANNKTHRTL
jgi:hypothetical protein